MVSAYLDDQLSPRDVTRFERHLTTCQRCREVLAETEDARSLLITLPMLTAPRSFQLTPAIAASIGSASSRQLSRPVALRLAQAVTAVAVIAFAAILTIDITGADSSSSNQAAGAVAPESSVHAASAPRQQDLAASPTTEPAPPDATSAETLATAAATAPAIAPPATSGIGAQGFSPETPSPTPQVTEAPPTPVPATATDGSTAEAFGAHDAAVGGSAKRAESRSGVDYASSYSESSTTAGWYRPAEFGLGAFALLAAIATASLAVRRRRL
jgi:anti-sigma factor RsiW